MTKKSAKEVKEIKEIKHKGQLREGIVTSDKMHKTVVVEVTRLMKHLKFKKYVRMKIRYVAHDEDNAAKTGDAVQISEIRPMSKRKRWKVVKVLS